MDRTRKDLQDVNVIYIYIYIYIYPHIIYIYIYVISYVCVYIYIYILYFFGGGARDLGFLFALECMFGVWGLQGLEL